MKSYKPEQLFHTNALYGEVPAAFEQRVQAALRSTEEAPRGRRLVMRAVVIAMLLTVLLGAVAYAAFFSNTAEFFRRFYGDHFVDEIASRGEVAVGEHTVQLGDVVFTQGDAIVTGYYATPEATYTDDSLCAYLMVTGVARPAPDANLVLIPEDFTLDLPWNYDPLQEGFANIPKDAVSVADYAREKGAKICRIRTVYDGLVDENGDLYPGGAGYNLWLQSDGTIRFSGEISLNEPIPRQESYRLQLYLCVEEVDPDTGEAVADSRVSDTVALTVVSAAGQP